MPTRRNRNGPVSRLVSPVNEGVGLVTRTGSRGLRTADGVWRTIGNGARNVIANASQSVNSAARRVLTGKRGGSKRKHTRRRHHRRH